MNKLINKEKQDILESHNFSYDFRRMIAVNDDLKKIFSFEYIEDHDPDWLEAKIEEQNHPQEWDLYFVSEINGDAEAELIKYLEDTQGDHE